MLSKGFLIGVNYEKKTTNIKDVRVHDPKNSNSIRTIPMEVTYNKYLEKQFCYRPIQASYKLKNVLGIRYLINSYRVFIETTYE